MTILLGYENVVNAMPYYFEKRQVWIYLEKVKHQLLNHIIREVLNEAFHMMRKADLGKKGLV